MIRRMMITPSPGILQIRVGDEERMNLGFYGLEQEMKRG
jgi:hypothetical protein